MKHDTDNVSNEDSGGSGTGGLSERDRRAGGGMPWDSAKGPLQRMPVCVSKPRRHIDQSFNIRRPRLLAVSETIVEGTVSVVAESR